MLSLYLTALLGTVAAQIAPGPNLLAVANTALSQGRYPAIFVALGIASGVLIWVSAFALGISALFAAYPSTLIGLQLSGGSYLIYLAIKTLWVQRNAQTQPASRRPQTQATPLLRHYRMGLFVVLTNPKAALMWAAITAFLSGAGLSPQAMWLFAPLGAFSAFMVYGSYALLFSTHTALQIYQRFSRRFELVMSAMFGLMGGKLIYDGINAIRST